MTHYDKGNLLYGQWVINNNSNERMYGLFVTIFSNCLCRMVCPYKVTHRYQISDSVLVMVQLSLTAGSCKKESVAKRVKRLVLVKLGTLVKAALLQMLKT